jgi:hypothetical protein
MQARKWWLASVLTAAVVFVGAVMAQPQEGGRGPGGGFQGGKGRGKGKGKGGNLTASEIVDRIMSYDKNNDGKITKDELPERLHYLIERGDTNKDGLLDKAEIEQLASTIAQDARAGVRPPGFGGGPFGGKGPPGGFKGKGGPGGFEQRALDELNLTGKTKDKAEAVLRTHQENVRKLVELARSDLLVKMKDVLSDQEYKTFKESMDRLPPPPPPNVAGAARTADLERRIDQLLKQVEELRREIKR